MGSEEYKGMSTGGMWTESEATNHINYLEMLDTLFGLQTFAKSTNSTHMRIMCDNTSVLVCSIMNDMGTSHSDACNRMAKEILEWCFHRILWTSLHTFLGNKTQWQISNLGEAKRHLIGC